MSSGILESDKAMVGGEVLFRTRTFWRRIPYLVVVLFGYGLGVAYPLTLGTQIGLILAAASTAVLLPFLALAAGHVKNGEMVIATNGVTLPLRSWRESLRRQQRFIPRGEIRALVVSIPGYAVGLELADGSSQSLPPVYLSPWADFLWAMAVLAPVEGLSPEDILQGRRRADLQTADKLWDRMKDLVPDARSFYHRRIFLGVTGLGTSAIMAISGIVGLLDVLQTPTSEPARLVAGLGLALTSMPLGWVANRWIRGALRGLALLKTDVREGLRQWSRDAGNPLDRLVVQAGKGKE